MNLGNHLFQARKRCGLTQEKVAEKLGVSRQTISKWETDETLPDIRQSKRLAVLYRLSLDELIDFDLDVQEVQQAIERTSAALEEKIDWTKAWGKKYPILLSYRQDVNVEGYAKRLDGLLRELRNEYGYNELDAFLVLKDILAAVWKGRKGNA
jgi:transcriptional regulator with XRE-family HTH domain